MLNVYFYRQDSKDVGSAKAPLALKDLQKASHFVRRENSQ